MKNNEKLKNMKSFFIKFFWREKVFESLILFVKLFIICTWSIMRTPKSLKLTSELLLCCCSCILCYLCIILETTSDVSCRQRKGACFPLNPNQHQLCKNWSILVLLSAQFSVNPNKRVQTQRGSNTSRDRWLNIFIRKLLVEVKIVILQFILSFHCKYERKKHKSSLEILSNTIFPYYICSEGSSYIRFFFRFAVFIFFYASSLLSMQQSIIRMRVNIQI